MNLTLSPEVEKFVAEQVKQGSYSSVDEVVQAGIARLMLDPPADELDDETIAAIEESEAQIDRGEGRPFKEVAAELRARFLGE